MNDLELYMLKICKAYGATIVDCKFLRVDTDLFEYVVTTGKYKVFSYSRPFPECMGEELSLNIVNCG